MKQLNQNEAIEVLNILGLPENTAPSTGGLRDVDFPLPLLQELVDKGLIDPDGTQNSSPSVTDFLTELAGVPNVMLIGYIVYPPRTDARVSIEGFRATGLSKGLADDLTRRFGDADEHSMAHDVVGWLVRFWWD